MKRVGVCFQNRYNESVLRMQRMVEEEEMGAPIGARAFVTWDRREAYYRESGWRGSWETEGGGVLMNQAIHTLDLLVLFLGKAVKAEAGMANHHLKGCIAVEDTMEAYMEFEQARACFYATNSYVKDAPILLEVAYEKAVFRLEGEGLRVFYADNRQYESNSQVISEGGKAYWGNSHKRCIEDFYSCLEKQIPCKNDLATTENTFCLVMDLYESAKCNSRG